jgi:anthranilate/para-aminobenzoate synthase component I
VNKDGVENNFLRMKNLTLLLAIILISNFTHSLFAQVVEVVKKGKSTPHERVTNFEYLEPNTIPKDASLVATLKATESGKDATIPNLFFALKYKTYQLQGNSFKVIAFAKEKTSNKLELTIDVYYSNDSLLLVNRNNHIKNTVFIFGDDKGDDETYSFSINEVEHEIKSGFYYKYVLAKGSQAEITQGKLVTNTMYVKWKENKVSQFLSLSKFGLAPTKESHDYLSRFFNMGALNPIDNDLGYLLASLLKREE